MRFSLRSSFKWSIFIAIVTFVLAALFSIISTAILTGVTWAAGMLIVLLFVVTGIVFDMMGLAAAAARETPFHSMAAERIKGAKHAIRVVRNADRFSNFCNDVIGDIAGVISGTASAFVILKLVIDFGYNNTSLFYNISAVVFAALVSALTVGGKAMGKSFSIHYATEIILYVGKVLYFLEKRFKISIFQMDANRTYKDGKRGNGRATRAD
jgi:CBS domain containing-hemolysin-like protein